MGSKCACESPYGVPGFSVTVNRSPGLASPGFAALVSNSYGVPGIGVAKARYNFRPRRGYGYGIPGIGVNPYGASGVDAQIADLEAQISYYTYDNPSPSKVKQLQAQIDALKATKKSALDVLTDVLTGAVNKITGGSAPAAPTFDTTPPPPPSSGLPSWFAPAAAAVGAVVVTSVIFSMVRK